MWLTLDNVFGKNSMISLVCGIIIGLTDAILELGKEKVNKQNGTLLTQQK